MSASKPAYAVMGGTFNPIHMGHLVAAEAAREAFSLDAVIFVPAGHPPHKEAAGVAAAEHRYLMTVLATATHHAFQVDRMEIDRPGPSFTSDTLRQLGERHAGARWYFITGADAVLAMPSWHDARGIIRQAEVIAASRPGYRAPTVELKAWLGADEDRVHALAVPALAISSSDIRVRVADGLSIRYLVPSAVADYIAKYHLYRRDDAPAP